MYDLLNIQGAAVKRKNGFVSMANELFGNINLLILLHAIELFPNLHENMMNNG